MFVIYLPSHLLFTLLWQVQVQLMRRSAINELGSNKCLLLHAAVNSVSCSGLIQALKSQWDNKLQFY